MPTFDQPDNFAPGNRFLSGISSFANQPFNEPGQIGNFVGDTFRDLGVFTSPGSGLNRHALNEQKDFFTSQLESGGMLRADLPGAITESLVSNFGHSVNPTTGALIRPGGVGQFTSSAGFPSSTQPATGDGVFNIPSTSNPGLQASIDAFSGAPGQFNEAFGALRDLPGTIDQFTQNALSRQRATGDQITGILNRVGNQRAGSGIMGGTEQMGLRSDLLLNLAKIFEENQSNIESRANQLKVGAIQQLPTTALSGVNAMTNLFNVNAQDQQFWANLAANMINQSF